MSQNAIIHLRQVFAWFQIDFHHPCAYDLNMICFFQHYHKPGWDLFTEQHTTHILDVHKNTTFWKGGNAIVFSTPPPFLASQDALEVMRVTELLDVLIDFTDVTLVSEDTY